MSGGGQDGIVATRVEVIIVVDSRIHASSLLCWSETELFVGYAVLCGAFWALSLQSSVVVVKLVPMIVLVGASRRSMIVSSGMVLAWGVVGARTRSPLVVVVVGADGLSVSMLACEVSSSSAFAQSRRSAFEV